MKNDNADGAELKKKSTDAHIVPPDETEDVGYVQLPVGEKEFRHFIKSLLGSPQSINNTIKGNFEIQASDLGSLNELILQRVTQQNNGFLIEFGAKIIYSDSSSVELNSIEELLTYNEIRPVVCREVHLKWDFVVQFQDKDFREKQRITVSFLPHRLFGIDSDHLETEPRRFLLMARGSYVSFRIEHTARSWGADMEALLSNHIRSLLNQPPRIRTFIKKHSAFIGLGVGVLFFLSSLFGAGAALRHHALLQLKEVDKLIQSNNGNVAVSAKLDYIATSIAGGSWPQYYLSILTFLLIAFCLSIIFGVWAGSAAEIETPSFILLTKESHKHKKKTMEKLQKQWLSFIAAITTSVVCGILGNILFTLYFAKLTIMGAL